MNQEKDHKHAALVTDLGFCLEQLEKPHPDMQSMAIELLRQRVTHHEVALSVESCIAQSESSVARQAELLVASMAEITHLPATAEPVLIPAAA